MKRVEITKPAVEHRITSVTGTLVPKQLPPAASAWSYRRARYREVVVEVRTMTGVIVIQFRVPRG